MMRWRPPVRFLVRRVLLAVPALLGICLVTFGLVHLAPGDPLAGSEGVPSAGSGAERASLRRLYFLDLPVFYNPDPRGLSARVERLAGRLAAAAHGREDAVRAVAAAARCGTVCVSGLAARLSGARGEEAALLRRALDSVRRAHPTLGPNAGDLDLWLRAVAPALDAHALERLAASLGDSAGVEQALVSRGSAALPALMERLLDGPAPASLPASRVAASLTRAAPALGAGDDGRALALWEEWWFRERRDHVDFTPRERAAGRLAETRFGRFLRRALTGRLGTSLRDGRPVRDKLAEALPVTLALGTLSLLLAYLFAIPLGVHAAVRRGRPDERAATVVLFLLYAVPPFWMAMLLILAFGGVGLWDVFPIAGLASPGLEHATGWTWLADRARHLVLPVLCLAYPSFALLSRHQRAALLEALAQDYVRTARAKGLPERTVLLRHALPNALLPLVTLLGLQLPAVIGGSVIVERIFGIPGMGLLAFDAFLGRDYPVVMAVTLLVGLVTLVGLILSDLLYALLDPRISLEEEAR